MQISIDGLFSDGIQGSLQKIARATFTVKFRMEGVESMSTIRINVESLKYV